MKVLESIVISIRIGVILMKDDKKNLKTNLAFLLKQAYMWDKKIYLYFALFTVISAVIPFIDIFFPKFIIDELTGYKRVNFLFIILMSFFLVSSILKYLYDYFKGISSGRIMSIRFKLMNLMQERSMKMDLKDTEDPEVLNKIETCSRAIASNTEGIEGVYHKLFEIVGAVITLFGFASIVITLSPYILLYLLFNVALIYYVTLKIKKYQYSLKDVLSSSSRKRNYVYDIMQNFAYGKEIRIFNLNSWLQHKFNLFAKEKREIENNIYNKSFIVSVLSVVLLFFREGLVYIYLINKFIKGDMSIGSFTMYFTTINAFASWMENIINNIAFIITQNLYVNDFREFIECENKEKESCSVNIPEDNTYEIEFRNIDFKYPNSNIYIFRDFSLKINKGEKLAIVGINGSGKTTLIKLLTRLYEPTAGEILLNGVNIKFFERTEYFKLFSVVFQEVKTFSFSIAENIALETEGDINFSNLQESIKKIGIGDKIKSLKNGVNTTLLKVLDSEGIELSGGENQRIAIARALYKGGKIMILDEPTAALDPIAEYYIYKKFDEIVEDKTAIYISHRLSSTRFCDKIAFFERGKIIEYGTHDELIIKNGRYAEMFNIQASYYREEETERKCL